MGFRAKQIRTRAHHHEGNNIIISCAAHWIKRPKNAHATEHTEQLNRAYDLQCRCAQHTQTLIREERVLHK